MTPSARLYRLLLRAYPEPFRTAFGQQMQLDFSALHRARTSDAQFWSHIVWDTIRSAPALRLEAALARRHDGPQLGRYIMKGMSWLAMLVGAITIANASVEGWVGGLGNHDGLSFVAGGLGILAGAALILAGILLTRRQPLATTRARSLALACLGSFLLMLAISPRLSVFANILGIGVPLLLVAWVQLNRGAGRVGPLMG